MCNMAVAGSEFYQDTELLKPKDSFKLTAFILIVTNTISFHKVDVT